MPEVTVNSKPESLAPEQAPVVAAKQAEPEMIKVVLVTPYVLVQPSTGTRLYQHNEATIKNDRWAQAQIAAKLLEIVK